jgi:hypothetical protein
MKIRIKGNSLRYRLTRTDVAHLVESGYLEDKVDFPGDMLTYALQLTDDEQLSSGFKENTITLFMPKLMLTELADTDKVGFEHAADNIYLLVEKDFTCIDNVAEDQSDNYPNPLAEKLYEQGK